MSNIEEQIQTLLTNYFNVVVGVESILIFDRDGLLISRKAKGRLQYFFDKENDKKKINDADTEFFGAITAIVESTLSRITKEYNIGNFGTGVFETEDNRLVFTEAGPEAILLTMYEYDVEMNYALPYCFLLAQKISNLLNPIFNERVVLSIPDLSIGQDFGISPSDITRPPVSYDEESVDVQFKLIVLGEQGVGKTSMINQFVINKFYSDYRPTLGLSITQQTYAIQGFEEQGSHINFMIWDLAGQRFFKRVRKHYYQNANAAFIIFDVTKPDTFKAIKKWFDDLRSVMPTIPIIIIGNKTDLKDQIQVTDEEGKKLAKELKASYISTSAKTGENVKDTFTMVGIGLFFHLVK